jgi:hypothetical protein
VDVAFEGEGAIRRFRQSVFGHCRKLTLIHLAPRVRKSSNFRPRDFVDSPSPTV